MRTPIKLILAGAGGRGICYAKYVQEHLEQAQIVGVAEPRDFYRNRIAKDHNISPDNIFNCWKDLAKADIEADAVIISTQDAMHVEPAVAFADKGYHMLLEKPMAPTEEGCRAIVEAAIRNKIIFGVCHSLRYSDYTRTLKELVDSGAVGDVVSIQHHEPVGYFHYAHSYVRGHWRNEAESSFMLLAKSCHDLDWLRYIMGCKCEKVSSFGSLYHFKKEQAPAGAAKRCLDCLVESTCPYSAKKIYLDRSAESPVGDSFVETIAGSLKREDVEEMLRDGPYGRCVYACDNDVVDNQVVNMQFAGGKTVSFTMTAFTEFDEGSSRKTRIFGTKGEIYGCDGDIELYDFLTNKKTVIKPKVADKDVFGGHGGADYYLTKAFIAAVSQNDSSKILSGPAESLETHLMVFAAEKARHTDTVVEIK